MKTAAFILGVLYSASLMAQQSEEYSIDTLPATPKIAFSGYLKNLQNLFFLNNSSLQTPLGGISDTFFQDNLIHHRLNMKWFPNEKLTVRAELRTRLFFGDLVRGNPQFARDVGDVNNDYLDLSAVLIDRNGFVLQTMLDRFSMEYTSGSWEISLGRQRINWGIGTVWNPNDIFNAFSFTDFDYEERPGSDALRIKYYTGFASSVEFAAKAFDKWKEAVAAGLWKINFRQYDIQLLAGVADGDGILGVGWAGNLKTAGFKGEATWFVPMAETSTLGLNATLGIDYSFPKGLFFQSGYLYNSMGSTKSGNVFGFTLSARNLYPYRHALFGALSYPFNPLLQGSLAIIYSPVQSQALFVNPLVHYSISENWGLDFVGQVVFNQAGNRYSAPIQAIFFRMKWSY
jgi:hypothetical protein